MSDNEPFDPYGFVCGTLGMLIALTMLFSSNQVPSNALVAVAFMYVTGAVGFGFGAGMYVIIRYFFDPQP